MNFLMEEGAAVMVDNSSNGSGGTIFVSGASVAQEIPKNIEEAFGVDVTLDDICHARLLVPQPRVRNLSQQASAQACESRSSWTSATSGSIQTSS